MGWFGGRDYWIHFPHTLGVGYDNIEHILSGSFVGFHSSHFVFSNLFHGLSLWAAGLLEEHSRPFLLSVEELGPQSVHLFQQFCLRRRLIFAPPLWWVWQLICRRLRALLASIVFAFETTRQPHGLMPLLGACSVSYLVSALLMRNTIMTEKLVRRGHHVPTEYVDYTKLMRTYQNNAVSLLFRNNL